MLDAMRRGAQGWLAKVLFALLILSFGVFWNVSDFISSAGRSSLAKVGDVPVTAEGFQRAFQNRLASLSTESQRVTSEMAIKFGLDRQVLNTMTGQAALLANARELGLGLSKQALIDSLKRNPDFGGVDGQFSPAAFDGFLRQTGMTEQVFLSLYGEDEVRRQLADALNAATVTPKILVEQAHTFIHEQRAVSHFTVDRAKLPAIAEPDDAKLKEYFEQNKPKYMAPETRKLAVLVLSIPDLEKEVAITDEEIKAAYEDTKATYDVPERRRIQQIAFKDKAAADEARKLITAGTKNFIDAAKETGAKETDINLGMLAKSQLIDPVIAEAAFALGRDSISEVIEGKFTNVLLRVIEIQPGKMSTLDDVKDKVRSAIASKKAGGVLQERADLVEESRNAGKTFKEIAETLKLKLLEQETTAKNTTPAGSPAFDLPSTETLLAAAFAAEQGNDHEHVELGGEAYAWYDVQAVTPSKLKEFDAVKDEIKADVIEDEKSKKIVEMAEAFVERLNKGEDIGKIAQEAGGKVESLPDLKRNISPPGMTEDAMRRAFILAKGTAGHTATSDGTTRVIYRVDDIKAAAPAAPQEADEETKELQAQIENSNLYTYIEGIKARLGVTIDEAAFKRITGADAQQQ